MDAVRADVARLDFVEPATAKDFQRLSVQSSRSTCLQRIGRCVLLILDEQGYVLIRGLEHNIGLYALVALGSMIGNIHFDPSHDSALFPAEVGPGATLMGNQLCTLPLHIDYIMLPAPPRYTLSLCVREDEAAGGGRVDIVDVEAAIYGMMRESGIKRFFEVDLPFASQDAESEERIIKSPILTRKGGGNEILVRHHRSRIVQGFCGLGREATPAEALVMRDFERFLSPLRERVHPRAGDILILDNHRTLDGRERCGVRLRADGTTSGRQMRFLFVDGKASGPDVDA